MGTRNKPGRPPKQATGTTSTLTLKIPTHIKNHIIQVAEGYDLTITDYLLTLIQRDAEITSKN
jgi:antitoxin component of RelBE/YafQ-DinJ toxin-antitoxin module